MPKPIVLLASGLITKADTLRVELHQPADLPAFVLVRWPAAPSVVKPNPRALAAVAASVVRVLAEAQTRLTTLRGR